MTTSLEDHAAIGVSGRLTVPPECLCDEYAHLILLHKELKEKVNLYNRAVESLNGWMED